MYHYFEEVDSTNRIAKELVEQLVPDGTVVHCGCQSAGRGQYERSFSSPAGGLYFTLILRPSGLAASRFPLITLATAVACHDVLFDETGLNIRIKWPNDLYVGEHKLGGILCESLVASSAQSEERTALIGVGVNVNSHTKQFSESLHPIVTTVFDETGKTFALLPLLHKFTAAITHEVQALQVRSEELLARWQNYDYLLNRPVCYTVGTTRLSGIGGGISAQGYYRVIDRQGVEHAVIGGQVRPAD